MTDSPQPRSAVEGSKSLLAFYYHSVFFLTAALLGIHTVVSFVGSGGMMVKPLLLGVEGVLALLAAIGSEVERGRGLLPSRSAGAFLIVMGVFQVALCVMTGALASPYFLLVACTSVVAGLTLPATRAMYVSAALACAYVAGVRMVPDADPSRGQAESVTALAVHVAFLLLATSLAARVSRRHRETVKTLADESMRDPLTSLENRRSFLAKMEGELRRAERFSWPITMLILDLDHFKRLNDEHGHPLGDAVLVEVACLLKDNIGPVDHIARIGGEEFAVAAVAAEPHHGRDLADRLVRAFRVRNWSRLNPGLTVTASIGVAAMAPGHAYAEPTALIREVMDRADKALYRVKHSGRDGFHVSTEDAAPTPSFLGNN